MTHIPCPDKRNWQDLQDGGQDASRKDELLCHLAGTLTRPGFTLAQALYELSANVAEVAFVGTAGTFYRRDHTTPAGTITLNSATAPTLRKRAT
jgi:hypothetical protein